MFAQTISETVSAARENCRSGPLRELWLIRDRRALQQGGKQQHGTKNAFDNMMLFVRCVIPTARPRAAAWCHRGMDGRRREIRTPDPLGVNVTTYSILKDLEHENTL
jgi:hypothetical protein